VCNLTGSEQLAGMKEVADWRCLKLDAKTLPNSQQPKRKKTQNVSKKNKLSQLQHKLPQITSNSFEVARFSSPF
jgi:hypothetical protein